MRLRGERAEQRAWKDGFFWRERTSRWPRARGETEIHTHNEGWRETEAQVRPWMQVQSYAYVQTYSFLTLIMSNLHMHPCMHQTQVCVVINVCISNVRRKRGTQVLEKSTTTTTSKPWPWSPALTHRECHLWYHTSTSMSMPYLSKTPSRDRDNDDHVLSKLNENSQSLRSTPYYTLNNSIHLYSFIWSWQQWTLSQGPLRSTRSESPRVGKQFLSCNGKNPWTEAWKEWTHFCNISLLTHMSALNSKFSSIPLYGFHHNALHTANTYYYIHRHRHTYMYTKKKHSHKV